MFNFNLYNNNLYKKIKVSNKQRLFIIGDIHGQFSTLDKLLTSISFKKDRDILISVGDIIDRGEESYRFINYINEPWFYMVLGNHEIMMYESLINGKVSELWLNNGGYWWIKNREKFNEKDILKIFDKLPLIIEVKKGNFKYGIVHSQTPMFQQGIEQFEENMELGWNPYKNGDWEEVVRYIKNIKREDIFNDDVINQILWDRYMIELSKKYIFNIDNIDLVFHGHTITKDIKHNGQHIWIDTGAYNGNCLTIVEVLEDNILKAFQYDYNREEVKEKYI